ncbi:hypothetical protein SY94_5208 (plasmid) [Agrobacterium tumefaciens]|nr:hypothetical protein SY94_5208 [Agrobacterium tumefaciens]
MSVENGGMLFPTKPNDQGGTASTSDVAGAIAAKL